MRLNKYIASCGVSSRRNADKLIVEGKISINGSVVRAMGVEVDEDHDTICYEGAEIKPKTAGVYIMLNKPAGYLSTCSDSRGRKTVIDLLDGVESRVFPVGRLDYDTEGMLILTNDGGFAYRCTHPKHEVDKKYFVIVKGILKEQAMRTLGDGVFIDGVRTAKARIEILNQSTKRTELFVTIHEGRNRQIKKMFALVGCRVSYLKRISIGNLELKDLPVGKWRFLTIKEKDLLDMKSKS